jgi:hypothetical protein
MRLNAASRRRKSKDINSTASDELQDPYLVNSDLFNAEKSGYSTQTYILELLVQNLKSAL